MTWLILQQGNGRPLKSGEEFGETITRRIPDRFQGLYDAPEDDRAAHIPIGVEAAGSPMGWGSAACLTEEELIAKLHTYPNLILWIAGHRHRNIVTALKSPDTARPDLGFWEVETSSLRDFPQQFRTFEIVRNSDDTVSIITTDVDPAIEDGSPAATSRTYAVAAQQIFNNPIGLLPTCSYNAELVTQLSPEMQAKLNR